VSDIDIQITHAMPLARARRQADRVAAQLKARFDLDSAWSGNTLQFSRQGVDGTLKVTATAVTVAVRLGLLFSFLKPKIEQQIRHNLDEVFAPSPTAAAKSVATSRTQQAKAAPAPKPPTAARRKA
jgi:putative polyhydroxyalkanoate system protein